MYFTDSPLCSQPTATVTSPPLILPPCSTTLIFTPWASSLSKSSPVWLCPCLRKKSQSSAPCSLWIVPFPVTPRLLLVLWTLLCLMMSLVPRGCPLLSSPFSLGKGLPIPKLPTAAQPSAGSEAPHGLWWGTDMEQFCTDCLVWVMTWTIMRVVVHHYISCSIHNLLIRHTTGCVYWPSMLDSIVC